MNRFKNLCKYSYDIWIHIWHFNKFIYFLLHFKLKLLMWLVYWDYIKISFRSTLVIQAFGYIILRTSKKDSTLKWWYWTNLCKSFEFKLFLKKPLLLCLVNTVDTKSRSSLEHFAMAPLLKLLDELYQFSICHVEV